MSTKKDDKIGENGHGKPFSLEIKPVRQFDIMIQMNN